MFARVGQVENAIGRSAADIEKTGLRIEAGGRPVRGAVGRWIHQGSVCLRLLGRHSVLAAPFGLMPEDQFNSGSNGAVTNCLPLVPVEHEEVSVARRLGEQLPRLSVHFGIEQDRRFDVVPVMSIVGRRLEVPRKLSSVGVEGHDRASK